AFRSGVDRKDQPFCFGSTLVLPGQDGELLRLKLLSMKKADGAGHQEEVALLDYPVQKGLSRPGAFSVAGGVADRRLEDAKALAGWEDALGDDPADHRRLLAGLQRSDRRDGGGVLVAARGVEEEIPGSVDP